MEYNIYSDKLKKKLEEVRPKSGERVQFIALNNESISLQGTSLVYDEGTNGFIPIANTVGKREVRDQSSTKDSLAIVERVHLTRENGYTQTIYGDRPDQIGLFDYLYLHPSNLNNKGKKGFKPPVNGYLFKMKNPDAEAQLELKREEDITIAKQLVFEMKDEELFDHAKGLWPNTYQYLSPNEIKKKLLDIAKVDPNKIKGLSQDVDVTGLAFIKKLEEDKVIEKKGNQWNYTSNGDQILKLSPKTDPYKQLINFLLKNEDVVEFLKDELKKTSNN